MSEGCCQDQNTSSLCPMQKIHHSPHFLAFLTPPSQSLWSFSHGPWGNILSKRKSAWDIWLRRNVKQRKAGSWSSSPFSLLKLLLLISKLLPFQLFLSKMVFWSPVKDTVKHQKDGFSKDDETDLTFFLLGLVCSFYPSTRACYTSELCWVAQVFPENKITSWKRSLVYFSLFKFWTRQI